MRVLYGDQVLPEVMSLINDAPHGSALRLMSGYFEPRELLGDSIARALDRGVTATLIVRGGRSMKRHGEAIAEFDHPGLVVHYVPWLHAKLYLSDSQGVATSMNLTENTSYNRGEVAVCVRANENPEGFRQMGNAFEHFLKEARFQALGKEPSGPAVVKRGRTTEATKRSSGRGHCIRCDAAIRLNPEKPLCPSCYDEWSEYENPDYKEKFCHSCGKESRTTIEKPLCKTCFAEAM